MRITIIPLIILLTLPAVAADATLQYAKIYADPFYRPTMTNGANYTSTITINPPDGISKVINAIITADVYITPTVTFNITINGQSCKTRGYQISTTYASAGQARITFDCTNTITTPGIYNITIRPTQANTGASTMWLDLTYQNKPLAKASIQGTEYQPQQNGTVFLQLLDNQQKPINNSLCYITIYNPDKTPYTTNSLMMYHLNSAGLYYYDFTTPSELGVYMLNVHCYYYNNLTYRFVEKDAYLSSITPTTNYGNSTIAIVGETLGVNYFHTLIQFNTTNLNNTINQTLLAMYAGINFGTPIISAYRITAPWNESNVTHANIPAINYTILDTKKITSTGWVVWDITNTTKAWVNGTYPNYGILLNASPSIALLNYTAFATKEANNTLTPQLLIIYTTDAQINEIRGNGEIHINPPTTCEQNTTIAATILQINTTTTSIKNDTNTIWSYIQGFITTILNNIFNQTQTINTTTTQILNQTNTTSITQTITT